MMLHYNLLLYNLLLVDISALVIETYGVYLQTSVGLADTNVEDNATWNDFVRSCDSNIYRQYELRMRF